MRLKGDALFALALFAIFSFGTYRSLVMDDPAGGPHDVGAAFFPFWVCVLIQVMTTVVFVQSVVAARREGAGPAGGAGVPMRARVILLSGILAFLFAYILVMERLGFIIASTLFLILVHQLLTFSESGRPSPPKILAVSAACFALAAGGLYFVFNTVFHLALP